jgi:tetratricopeptide (TPR) repeat protein
VQSQATRINTCAPSILPPCSKHVASYCMSVVRTNLDTAQLLKANGNQLVQQKLYKDAVKQYVKIFLYIRGIKAPPMAQLIGQHIEHDNNNITAQVEQEIQALELSANLNLALCYLKLKDFEKAIKFADDALKVDSENIKALFRRGSARAEKKMYDEARSDFEIVLSKSPQDAATKNELEKISKLEKKQDEAIRKKFVGFFEKVNLSADEDKKL